MTDPRRITQECAVVWASTGDQEQCLRSKYPGNEATVNIWADGEAWPSRDTETFL